MGNHVKARPKSRPKPKSVKAKINRKMGSKRRTQRMGKELKKGEKGAAASYLTRAQVLRRLQISLRDFRRLCILKGVYPRDPSKKASGKASDKTYYHIKDVGFLAHEPVLQSFRDFKAFMRKLRRTIGRKNIKDAQRKELNERPTYKLDHLVKERYPRFLDAVRDLDDALSLVHLFASLPQMRRQSSAHTQTCKRLVKEWSFYVSKAKCLSKVFVSIKGIYFQAEVMGQPVTWVTPHMFTTRYPRDVDFTIMMTFLEFYETLLKFAMFKLFHTLDLRYPPTLDAELDGVDAGLSTLKTQSLEGAGGGDEGGGEGPADGEEEEEEEHRVLPSTKEERREAKKRLKEEEKKLKSLEAKLGQISRADKEAAAAAASSGSATIERGGLGEEDEEDAEMGDALTGPLEEAFMSRTEEGEEILADDGAGGEEERRKRLFKGLKFFFGREVPKSWLELVVTSCGGMVGWEGEGSPFSSADPDITHQIVDRPVLTEPRRKRREYLQPQWVLDSLNARVLLPVARYAPGAALPPHLSPFVNDSSEGYVPAYREELDKLRSAAEARRKRGGGSKSAEEGTEEAEAEDDVLDVVPGVATDISSSATAAGTSSRSDDEAEEDGDGEEAFAKDLERERAGTAFSKAKALEEEEEEEEDSSSDDDDSGDSSSEEEEEDAMEEVAPRSAEEKKQTEEQEHHEMSRNMMSKKAKRLYGRMQHGLSKRREEVERLKAKRKKLEAQYDAPDGMAAKKKKKKSKGSAKNKERSSSS
ncbi:unnamed protein product [Ectocarpus sp. 12 AP-2014]